MAKKKKQSKKDRKIEVDFVSAIKGKKKKKSLFGRKKSKTGEEVDPREEVLSRFKIEFDEPKQTVKDKFSEEISVENPVVDSAANPAANPVVKFRIFSGCSGWGPGQLEFELDRADWQLQPAEAELVFDYDPHEIWSTLRQRFSILPNLRGDPKLN